MLYLEVGNKWSVVVIPARTCPVWSVTWKGQQAALSSVQMTLNQEEQLIYSKTGPLEQKLKERADQLIVLCIHKGQSKVLWPGKTFLLEGFSSSRKNLCSALPTTQQLCCWQQFPVAWLCGEHLWGKGPGRQQAVHEPECALAAKEAISILHQQEEYEQEHSQQVETSTHPPLLGSN